MKIAFAAAVSMVMVALTTSLPGDVYDGQPRFDQGNAAYYVWRDGGSWHVRWIASERQHEYKGTVSVAGGSVRALRENDSEKEALAFLSSQHRLTVTADRIDPGLRMPDPVSFNRAIVRPDGTDKIVFEARTTNSIGGFDFAVTDSSTSIQLDLLIDRNSVPALVKLGKSGKKATAMPLVISLAKDSASQ